MTINRMLLDDRILFPGKVLAGFARLDLARRMKDLRIHGLMGRGYNNIALLVSQTERKFQISVRLRCPEPGIVFVTTVHRQVASRSEGMNGLTDEGREFVEQDPQNRLFMKASRSAFFAYHDAAVNASAWDRALVARERREIYQAAERLALGDGYVAFSRAGYVDSVLPAPDLSLR